MQIVNYEAEIIIILCIYKTAYTVGITKWITALLFY